MALRKTVTLEDNFRRPAVFTDAYIRVNAVTGSKHRVEAHVGFYSPDPQPATVPAVDGRAAVPNADSNFLCTKQYSFVPDMNGGNFIAQAYAALKREPEFAGATDC